MSAKSSRLGMERMASRKKPWMPNWGHDQYHSAPINDWNINCASSVRRSFREIVIASRAIIPHTSYQTTMSINASTSVLIHMFFRVSHIYFDFLSCIPIHDPSQNPRIPCEINQTPHPKSKEHILSKELELISLVKPKRLRSNPYRQECDCLTRCDGEFRKEQGKEKEVP
jgi:hypothetical protein